MSRRSSIDRASVAERVAKPATAGQAKLAWVAPVLERVGPLAALVHGGGGKLSAQFDGDGRKPVGAG